MGKLVHVFKLKSNGTHTSQQEYISLGYMLGYMEFEVLKDLLSIESSCETLTPVALRS